MKAIEKSIPQIIDGLGISRQDIRQTLDASKNEPKFQPIVIKPAASLEDIVLVESHRADIPVLELLMVQRRRYPHGQMLANTIGYVGEVSPQQRTRAMATTTGDGRQSRPRAPIQRNLEGTDGMSRVVVNSVGKAMRTLNNLEAIPGKPIQLTIDYDLQAIAEKDMPDKYGAVVAIDARTGEVLAMVSRPTFDPNDFAVRIPA